MAGRPWRTRQGGGLPRAGAGPPGERPPVFAF